MPDEIDLTLLDKLRRHQADERHDELVELWRVIAGQGSTMQGLGETLMAVKSDFKDHQLGEDRYREREREAMEIMSGKIATLTLNVREQLVTMGAEMHGKLEAMEARLDIRLSAMNDTMQQDKGGKKMFVGMITMAGAIVLAVAGFVAWAASFIHIGPKA